MYVGIKAWSGMSVSELLVWAPFHDAYGMMWSGKPSTGPVHHDGTQPMQHHSRHEIYVDP